MNIYFLQFLPKINRIVRRYPDFYGYRPFIIQEIGALDATNFPYNDGINTQQIFNFETKPDKMPDYAILVDDEGSVSSRWYIEETLYKRRGQWRIKFRRDVLSDFKDEIINATSLIEKATVGNNDPAIYNQEAIAFNMIKKGENVLQDQSKSAWLVGYISDDNSAEKTYTADVETQIRKTVNGIQNWQYYKYISTDFQGSPQNISYNIKFRYYLEAANPYGRLGTVCFNKEGATRPDIRAVTAMGYGRIREGDYAYIEDQVGYSSVPMHYTLKWKSITETYDLSELRDAILSQVPNHQSIDNVFLDSAPDIYSALDEGSLKGIDGTYLYDSSSLKTYRVSVISKSIGAEKRFPPNHNSALWQELYGMMMETGMIAYNSNAADDHTECYVKYNANIYRVELTEVEDKSISVPFTSVINKLNDAPYRMFAIPFNGIRYIMNDGTYESNPTDCLAMAKSIAIELYSSGALYDLQLLPYCPRQDLIKTDSAGAFIDLRDAAASASKDYEIIEDQNEEPHGFVVFCKGSSFTFDINLPIEITEKKVQNQCDNWRLCSPNYNGVFEFNAAKNNGVDYFNVDCTYRPYNPYIHINPNFKELYGNDYDDARGLICSGDFSMPAVTSRWLEYEAQNKNYQQSFDRSIQHMEIEQKYERINQIAGAVSGSASGAMLGGISGGVAGAVAGGLVSAAAGVADVYMGEQLRSENLRYAKDQFKFNLENIKALPNSLAKVSAFTKNNKIFPFLEYYSCTDIEKEAFREFIKYDGMTVNRIGRIADYLIGQELQFVKARLIRIEDLHDDQHIVDVIASEMEKGAYYDPISS